jgi:hypothetical protein
MNNQKFAQNFFLLKLMKLILLLQKVIVSQYE